MARVRNKKGIALYVPELSKTVEPDEVVEVPDDRLEAYVSQVGTWGDESGKSVPAKGAVADAPVEETSK